MKDIYCNVCGKKFYADKEKKTEVSAYYSPIYLQTFAKLSYIYISQANICNLLLYLLITQYMISFFIARYIV